MSFSATEKATADTRVVDLQTTRTALTREQSCSYSHMHEVVPSSLDAHGLGNIPCQNLSIRLCQHRDARRPIIFKYSQSPRAVIGPCCKSDLSAERHQNTDVFSFVRWASWDRTKTIVFLRFIRRDTLQVCIWQ